MSGSNTEPAAPGSAKEKPQVYIFGWPTFLGGADTKLHHLLLLLHRHCHFTIVPTDPRHLENRFWTTLMDRLAVRYVRMEDLPPKLEGFALALCNVGFFLDRIAHRAKEKGLEVIWSGEMMWHHPGELEAVKEGVVDRVLYVSETQRSVLQPGHGEIPWHITGNYIDPAQFPFIDRRGIRLWMEVFCHRASTPNVAERTEVGRTHPRIERPRAGTPGPVTPAGPSVGSLPGVSGPTVRP